MSGESEVTEWRALRGLLGAGGGVKGAGCRVQGAGCKVQGAGGTDRLRQTTLALSEPGNWPGTDTRRSANVSILVRFFLSPDKFSSGEVAPTGGWKGDYHEADFSTVP